MPPTMVANILTVSPTTESQVRNIAARIPARFQWTASGPKLEVIAGLLLDDLRAQKGRKSASAVTGFVAQVLRGLEDNYGWATPGVSLATENGFFDWFASEYVKLHW